MRSRFAKCVGSSVLFWAFDASAVVMRHDFYDPGLTNPTKEVRYQNLANQSRFDAVGALTLGVGINAFATCSGTLINASTVLTAAHCLSYSGAGQAINVKKSDLSNYFLSFGPSASDPSKVLRISDYSIHPSWTSGGINGQDLGFDLALLNVYDPVTQAPVNSITPAFLQSASDELVNSVFPVMVGYGTSGYAANVSAGPSVGQFSPSGIKRAALNNDLTLTNTSSLNDTLTTELTSPGNLFAQGLPSNFLEGGVLPGDSGGGLFIANPLSPTGWALAGVTSYITGVSYNQFPLTGGGTSNFVRISEQIDWIVESSFGPATYFHPTPQSVDGSIMIAGNGNLSTQGGTDCNSSSPLLFDYGFLNPTGTLSISFGGTHIATITGASGLTGQQSLLIPSSCGNLNNMSVAGLAADLAFNFFDPAGGTFLMDNVTYLGLQNGDFGFGLAGWEASDKVSLIIGLDDNDDGSSVPEPSTLWTLSLGLLALLRFPRSRPNNGT